MIRLLVLALAALPAAAFADQGASISIPEPGDAALFVVAVVGLIVGRHVSRKPPTDND